MRVPLGDDLRAPGQARRAVREVLLSWRLPGLVDAAVLVVSELVTNALRHGRPPVHLVLHRHRRSVRLDVHDTQPALPREKGAVAADAESGRGLHIVSSLADEVGCESLAGDGKVVHVSFSTAGADQTPP